MNNLTSLFPPNYKNLEQKDAIKLLEQIEEVVKELDKGCYCCNSAMIFGGHYKIAKAIDNGKIAYYLVDKDKLGKTHINNCPICGRNLIDLRKEEL